MYREIITERRVREQLRERYGRKKVDRVEPVETGVFRARMVDGGLAFATVEGDGSISIKEQEVVC